MRLGLTSPSSSPRCRSAAQKDPDGFVPALGAVWEAKHTSAFVAADDVVARYMPQLQHNMAVVGSERAVLSVIFGNSKWEVFEIAADWM